jgi:hypothetical protein
MLMRDRYPDVTASFGELGDAISVDLSEGFIEREPVNLGRRAPVQLTAGDRPCGGSGGVATAAVLDVSSS